MADGSRSGTTLARSNRRWFWTFVTPFLAGLVVFWATGVWEGAVVCGAVALGLVFQSGSVIFSRGREYWFR